MIRENDMHLYVPKQNGNLALFDMNADRKNDIMQWIKKKIQF